MSYLEGAKLYYSTGSCSSTLFVTARQLGIKLHTEIVDLSTHKTASGVDFYTINPKGNVPALVLHDGVVLNETATILQFLADLRPEVNILGNHGHINRYLVLNELNFVASELHPCIGNLWAKSTNQDVANFQLSRAHSKLEILETKLSSKNQTALWLANGEYSVADLYAYVVLGWCKYVGLELDKYSTIQKFINRVSDLDFVIDGYKKMNNHPISTL